MKFRCVTNSIRLRLLKSEVKQLISGNEIAISLNFPLHQTLKISLLLDPDFDHIHALLKNGKIQILLPSAAAKQWAKSEEQEGISHQLPIGDQYLDILIEKDFPCKDRENEDKANTFWELAEKKSDSC